MKHDFAQTLNDSISWNSAIEAEFQEKTDCLIQIVSTGDDDKIAA